MGLDLNPIGKPIAGFEERYDEIINLLETGNISPDEEEKLLDEFFDNQISPLVTVKAPKIGESDEANVWAKEYYDSLEEKPPFEEFMNQMNGRYIPELALEKDGIAYYQSMVQNVCSFRGQFLDLCEEILGEDLVGEAWYTKTAKQALDYAQRLDATVTPIAKEHNLEYLREQIDAPETDENAIESQLHIVFSLIRWLNFYGQHGHAIEADY